MEKGKVIISMLISIFVLSIITGLLSQHNLVPNNGLMQLLLALILFAIILTFIFMIVDTIFDKVNAVKERAYDKPNSGVSSSFSQNTDKQLLQVYLDAKLRFEKINPDLYTELVRRKILIK